MRKEKRNVSDPFGTQLPTATPHNGTLVATAANQKVYGLGGADFIQLGLFGDIGYGGDGSDIIRGTGSDLALYGEAGNDILQGGSGNDRLDGGIGNDMLQGGAGDDMIFGGGDFSMAFNSRADYDRFAIDGTPLLQRDSAGRFVLPSGLVGSTGVDDDAGHPLEMQSLAAFQFPDRRHKTRAGRLQTRSLLSRDGEWAGITRVGAGGTMRDWQMRMAA